MTRNRAEAIGVESLLSQDAVVAFQAGPRRAEMLPELIVNVFISNGNNPDLNGRQNLSLRETDGLRMRIAPILEDYGQDIRNALEQDPSNFPFEYYAVRFTTFTGAHCTEFRRYIRHLMLDSAHIYSEHAAQEYTRAVYSVNVPMADRYRLENRWRQGKNHFSQAQLTGVNQGLDTYQFALRTGQRSGLEANLDITEQGISIRDRGKGRQCFIKTEFALRRLGKQNPRDALLLEEPENHLSHHNMKKLVRQSASDAGADPTV